MNTEVATLGTSRWKASALKDVKCPGTYRNGLCGRLLFRANLKSGQLVEIKCPKCKSMQTIAAQ